MENSSHVAPDPQQEDFIRRAFASVCRFYFGVSLVEKFTWLSDGVCRVKVTGIHPELVREFEHRIQREIDATGFSLLGCNPTLPEGKLPSHVFEVKSRFLANSY